MTNHPHAERLKALQAALASQQLDALLVTNLTNIRYLCGFDGSYGVLIVDRSGAFFITDGRYAEVAEHLVTCAKIDIQPLARTDEWYREFFRQRGYDRLGFEGSMSVDAFENLKGQVRPARSKLARTGGIVEQLREIKDPGEIKIIAKAAKTADRMMEAACEHLKPGVTELDLSRLIRRSSEEFGGEGESFANIVAGGPNGSRPHHHPGRRRLRAGDAVTIDLGAVVEGYCSDMTRNPVVGRVSRRFEEIYAVCLEAQEAALKAVRPGTPCQEVDAIAREIIASRGFGDFFNHGLGHGVGLQIHEGPRLNKTSTAVLKPGHVVTVEPGIYIPGVAGVRIEDLVVVTEGKPRILSRATKSLTILPT
ncbi:MAG: Xaa-Pro aminopeptidase [Candidatus Sumerlaeota bacterium]|nr:Xaa-Pro aminopeptidase [Candidatus Sumerlaeota bacterium]